MGWDVNCRSKTYGNTTLLQFVYYARDGDDSLGALRALLAAGSNVEDVNDFGMGVLHAACLNLNSAPKILGLLLETGVDVNMQMWPQTDIWKEQLKSAQDMVRAGSHREVLRELACWEGATPLMLAVSHGKLEEVCQLIYAKADVEVRNSMGQTALDMVSTICGGDGCVPTHLHNLLCCDHRASSPQNAGRTLEAFAKLRPRSKTI